MTKINLNKPAIPHQPTVDGMFYTYVWKDASGVPFYVGKGKGKRMFSTTERSPAFKEILAQGGCAVEVADYFMHESQAHAHEVELIYLYGRRDMGSGTLVNRTDGGEGTSGSILSDETKAKISRAAIGRPFSEEHRRKISEGNKGRKLSPAHVELLRQLATGRPVSEETKRRVSEANTGNMYALGVVRSAETRLKISESKKGQRSRLGAVLSAESRRKISDALRGRQLSEEHRAKLSEIGAGKKKTAEHVSKVANALHLCPPRAGIISGFKGVSRNRTTWIARIHLDSERKVIGYFSTAEEAARAYDAAALDAWGLGNCYLNFGVDLRKEEA